MSATKQLPASVWDLLPPWLASRITVDNTCWLYTGSRTQTGYGFSRHGGQRVLTHRLTAELFHGAIPDGLRVDHLCRVRACCNPEHLELVTQRENVLRGVSPTAVNAAKRNCAKGHEYTPENIYLYGGRRICKTCNRAKTAARCRARNAAATACRNGHEYPPSVVFTVGVRRVCPTCMAARRHTECPRGHALVGKIVPGRSRNCRECPAAAKRAQRAALRAQQAAAS